MRLDRIKLITQMAKNEISAKSLADEAGVSPTTICSIRAGLSCANKTGRALAKALNVPLADLVIDESSQVFREVF